MERLWTPWRMRYVSGESGERACIFCVKPAENDDVGHLILYRGSYSYLIMNLYPYNTGHVMAVPYQHAADLSELDQHVHSELFSLLPWITAAQRRVLRCDGFNIGLNLGSIAGAGVADHLHVHIVPRWEGDANFMPILANTMVLPELIPVTYAKLRAELEVSALDRESPDVVPQAGAIVWLPDERKIALRRAADGSIVLPKGHIEVGEAAFETARREVWEEMGLDAIPAGWAGTLMVDAGGKRRKVAHIMMNAERTDAFAEHEENDTLLLSPVEAVNALTHASARELLHQCICALERDR